MGVNQKKHISLTFVLIGIIFLTVSCSKEETTRVTSVYNQPSSFIDLKDNYWWSIKFRMEWPEGEDADFAMDLLLAHGVVSPVLARYRSTIPYWRFHRRASRDEAGHQFSFLFNTTTAEAESIISEIRKSVLLKGVRTEKLVKEVIFDDVLRPEKKNIGDTSDASWSENLQKNWPSFIMGVSALWLGLIDDSFTPPGGETTDVEELMERYRDANERISEIWRDEGHHALFHHLNAIFGYEKVLIKKKMTF